jgi:hypothetical protein
MKLITLYQVRIDASGELMKDASGTCIFAPVYNEGQQKIASLRQTGGEYARLTWNFPQNCS